jgi:hypothetical protein
LRREGRPLEEGSASGSDEGLSANELEVAGAIGKKGHQAFAVSGEPGKIQMKIRIK